MADPTIAALETELIELVKQVPEFKGSGYSVFDFGDLMAKTDLKEFPLAAVSYNGSAPTGKNGVSVDSGSPSAVMCEHQFIVVVAIQYGYSGQEDTKQIATNLLDQIRSTVLGYRGVNSRPWRWMGENPEPEASNNGTVFYSQVWHTSVPAKGNYNN